MREARGGPSFAPEQEQLERSTRVLIYKSAKYSVEAPLLIGAALAGASAEQEQALADFGLPVGVSVEVSTPWPRVDYRRWQRHPLCPSHPGHGGGLPETTPATGVALEESRETMAG